MDIVSLRDLVSRNIVFAGLEETLFAQELSLHRVLVSLIPGRTRLIACSTEELLYIAMVRDVTSTSIGYICTCSKPRRNRIEGVSSETRRSNTLNDAVYRIVLSAGSGGVQ